MEIWNYLLIMIHLLINDALNNKLKLPVGGGKCLNDWVIYSLIWFVQMADSFRSEVNGSLWLVHWIIKLVWLEADHHHQIDQCVPSKYCKSYREQTASWCYTPIDLCSAPSNPTHLWPMVQREKWFTQFIQNVH